MGIEIAKSSKIKINNKGVIMIQWEKIIQRLLMGLIRSKNLNFSLIKRKAILIFSILIVMIAHFNGFGLVIFNSSIL
jgi:hypothetical protein